MKLYLYLLTQNENTGYDTISSCVVVATSAYEASKIHPYGDVYGVISEKFSISKYNAWEDSSTWAKNIDNVKAKYIGIADESLKENEVVCYSFHAG